jgi:ubiquinone/menaquinone biosynthesis C-methylase UbiE
VFLAKGFQAAVDQKPGNRHRKPMVTDASRAKYDEWHGSLGLELECNCVWHQQVKASLPRVGGLSGKRVLEIGCGRGAMTMWLASQVPAPASVVGADFSPSAIDLARKLSASVESPLPVTWSVEDIQHIQAADSSFDLVISCETIEHVPDPRKALGELARVLRPGGWLMLTFPNYFSTIGLYRIYGWLRGRHFTEEGQPINHPLRATQVLRWVRGAGLSVRHFQGRGHFHLWPGRAPRELRWIEKPNAVMRWVGFHPLVIARKEQ